MNKILIDNNKITSTDKTILIDNNTIKFTTSGDYEIEYINCSNINYIYDINNNNICLFEFAINQELDINNTYNINSGNLVLSKFYNNKKVKENIVINLFNERASVDYRFDNICIQDENYNIEINHKNKFTNSNIINRSVALDKSKLDFTINSNVPKESIKSVIDQNTRIVTLGDSLCHISPNMLIDIDDVSAKHGSVIGTFDDNYLFYLMSKGLSYNDSLKLLIKGYLLSNLSINYDKINVILDIINTYWG